MGVVFLLVTLPVVFGVLPVLLSFVGDRLGWNGGPGAWNLPGLVVIVAGAAVVVWVLREHVRAAPGGWEAGSPHTPPEYLLRAGPYAWSRNPLYVGEQAIWFGWAWFLGSAAVLAVILVALVALVLFVEPHEAGRLEDRYGDAYRSYVAAVPRWLGRRAPTVR